VESPYVDVVEAGTYDYYIEATNSEGTIQSNTDEGTSESGTLPPSPIDDLVASDDEIGQVTITWTHSVGSPVPTHTLYRDGSILTASASSPYTDTVAAGTYEYYVEAKNSEGTEISNTDEGTSLEDPSAPPPAPTNVKIESCKDDPAIGNYELRFSWDSTCTDCIFNIMYDNYFGVADDVTSPYIHDFEPTHGADSFFYIEAVRGSMSTLSDLAYGKTCG
jgi:hypothetical protein